MHAAMKEKIRQKYYRCIKLILKSELDGRNMVAAINSYCIAALKYTAGLIK